jgi:hypothetical protein
MQSLPIRCCLYPDTCTFRGTLGDGSAWKQHAVSCAVGHTS